MGTQPVATDSNTAVDDRELLERLRHDDEHALATVFCRYQRPVYWGSFSVLRNRAEAEEIAGDVFLTLWRKRQSVEIAAISLLPWLLVTARNLALNRSRSISRRREQPITEPEDQLPASGTDPSEQMLAREIEQTLQTIVAAMAEPDRSIYQLCLVDEFTYKEAAYKLGLSHGAVRNRLSRLRARLRTELTHFTAGGR
ncbi:RNA polymerase sigma factor [Agrococcus sp. KRD186]|uniref:RNA polymerase sigma factor n=1 Tax=Agrococcus sp. KRD186 TaxID=2729730 RepID=UPI0019CF8D3A|nr:sigma-70 family RNA polymerase sigma factor [Agrococcus sp. KRD186]